MFRSSDLWLRVEDSTLGSLHGEDELLKLSAVPLALSRPQERLLRVRIGSSTTAFETESNDTLWPIAAFPGERWFQLAPPNAIELSGGAALPLTSA
jgi:hypothetical protein